jgi:hypothetical protein
MMFCLVTKEEGQMRCMCSEQGITDKFAKRHNVVFEWITSEFSQVTSTKLLLNIERTA